MKNKDFKPLEWIVCPNCGYNNSEKNVNKYGTCTGCRHVLDEKAKYKYEMVCRLKLWKGKKWF